MAPKKSKSSQMSNETENVDDAPSTFASRNTHVLQKQSYRITKRAGLVMPVNTFLKKLKKGNYAAKIRKGAGIYCAAAIEYLVVEWMEMSGEAARANKKKRIIPRHLYLAAQSDPEFETLLTKVTIPSGGVWPYIHESLLKINRRSSRPKAGKSPKISSPSLASTKTSASRTPLSDKSAIIPDSDSD